MFTDNLGKIYQQAQQMQKKMQEAKEELEKQEITGSAGLNAVNITMNGKFEAIKVNINEKNMDDKAILEELIISAINDATQRINDNKKNQLKDIGGDLNIPGNFKMPWS